VRVQFIHGLEGSPQGTKARLLAEHFEARTPAMDTGDFEGCVTLQAEVAERFRPDVLVGSSFGGAVAVALLQRGLWRGPTLLLAQAARSQGLDLWLPEGVTVWIVHGSRDDLVPPEQSRALARTGSPGRVRLLEVDDDHPLHASVEGGELLRWVEELAQERGASAGGEEGVAQDARDGRDAPDAPPATIDHAVDLPGRGPTWVRDIPGPPGAPAVVLLHGLGATARLNWGPSFRPLSRHFRVLALDHRGHGRGLRTRRFRLEDCADDAVHAAEARGVERFVAAGYSMGGPIASLAWRRHPDRVAGLVLCATARHFAPRPVARAARVLLPLAAGGARLVPALARRRLLERMLVRVEHPELRERIREEFTGHHPATVIQAAGALGRFSSHDWIGSVRVPVAVVVTTRDDLVPPVRQHKLAASIPGAEVYEVEGDHGACVAVPERFTPALVEACRSVARRGGLVDG